MLRNPLFRISFAKICKVFLISKLIYLKIVKNIVKTAKKFAGFDFFIIPVEKFTLLTKKLEIFGYFPFLHYIYKVKG